MSEPHTKVQEALDAWRRATDRQPRPEAQERARRALLASVGAYSSPRTIFSPRRALAFVLIAAMVLFLVPSQFPTKNHTLPPTLATNEISLAASYIAQAPTSPHAQQLLTSAATLLAKAHQQLPQDHSAPVWKQWEDTQKELVTTEREVEHESSPSVSASPSPTTASSTTPKPVEGSPSPSRTSSDGGGDAGSGGGQDN